MATDIEIANLTEQVKAVAAKFADDRKSVKEAHEELTRKMSEHRTEITAEFKKQVDETLTTYNEKFEKFQNELRDLEQKSAGFDGRNGAKAEKSIGEQFSEKAKQVDGFNSGFRGTVSTSVKQITSATSAGLAPNPYRDNDYVALQRERFVVRDLLNVVPINTSSVDYVVQTVRTNNAAPVAEGAQKPYSDFEWSSASTPVRTLAHLAKITRQAMDDHPRLVAELNSEMRYGLAYVEERQELYGNGQGQNLHGIIPQATAFALPAGFATRTGATKLDVLRVAMLQIAMGQLPADGIVLNSADWADIELTKTTDGAYLFANPQGTVSARMWGLPVVETPAMNAGDFLVGNFRMGATLYDRMSVELLLATENVDDFEKNLATVRCEERIAMAVKRPYAFSTGSFATAVTALTA